MCLYVYLWHTVHLLWVSFSHMCLIVGYEHVEVCEEDDMSCSGAVSSMCVGYGCWNCIYLLMFCISDLPGIWISARSCDTVTLHYFFRTTGPGPGVQRDLDAPRYLGVPAPIPHDNPNLSVSDFVVVAPTWAFWMSSSPLSLASLASHWRSCCGPVPDHSRRPITS